MTNFATTLTAFELTMHQALQIQEVLRIIFAHFFLPGTPPTTSDLHSLARTCRAFKEPALDLLWKELQDLSPLARCLPEVSYQISTHKVRQLQVLTIAHCLTANVPCFLHHFTTQYSFSRPLTQTEWDILQGYARRIRSVWDFQSRVDKNFLKALLRTGHSFRTSAACVVNIQLNLCICCSFPSRLSLPSPSTSRTETGSAMLSGPFLSYPQVSEILLSARIGLISRSAEWPRVVSVGGETCRLWLVTKSHWIWTLSCICLACLR